MQRFVFDIFFKRVLILAFVAVGLYILYLLKSVIAPFAVAFVLSYFLNPIVSTLSKYMSRFSAIMVLYAMIGAIVILAVSWAVPTLWNQATIMWGYIPVAVDWYNNTGREWLLTHTSYEFIKLDYEVVREHIINYFQSNYQVSDAQSFAMQVLSSGLSAINAVGVLALLPVLMFYFLINWQGRLHTWFNAVPQAYRPKVLNIAQDCDKALMSFVRGQLLVMVLLGLVYAVQLQLIGLKVGLIIGMIAGIASLVPYLGFGVGIVAAIIAGFVQFGADWVKLGLILGAFGVGQTVEGYILQPLLLGNKIGLSALWVIFAVLAGAALFGFVGMLIALPVAALINVLFHHAYQAYQDSDYYKGRRQYRLF